MKPRSISFVAPAYNENASFPELIAELHAVGQKLGIPYEIIIVDDGSTDGSAAQLARIASTDSKVHPIILRRNMGKATALMAGFQHSRGDVVVTLDADLQNDPNEVPKMLERLAQGDADIVSGWKFDRPDHLEKRLPSRFFNYITSHFTQLQLHDFNSGIKAYTRTAAQALDLYGELHRYIPVLASQLGFTIVEVQTHTRERKYGETKYKAKRYLRGFFDLLTILFLTKYSRRPLHLFGGLGALIGGLGMVAVAYLLVVKIFAHQAIGTRPLLTFGVFAILVGLQLFMTGLLAELFVRHSGARQLPIRDEWNAAGPLT
ncbi:MAG: glycosyltransferase family 2 protein [Patescibacteria group bacterium]